MRITKIEVQKHRPDRRTLYAEGEYLIGLHVEVLLRSGLRSGDDVSPEQLAALQGQDNLLSARSTALKYLSTRPRSEREIRDKLREKEFTPQEIDQVVADLARAGLVDDHEFARIFIRNSMAVRPIGELQLRRKLLLLGVAKQTIDDALGEIGDALDIPGAAVTLARQFLKRKGRGRQTPDPRKTKQQLIGFLSRRGFAWPVIASTLKSVVPALAEENTNDE